MSSNGNDTTPSERYKEEHNSLVPTKAKEAGQSLKEKIKSVSKKRVRQKDAHDIQALGATRLSLK
jgi:hypothetical protein